MPKLDSENVKDLILLIGGIILVAVVTVLSFNNMFDTIPDLGFEIDSVRTTSINVSGSAVTAEWNISFAIQNTDMYIFFRDMSVSVSYKSEQLATGPLPYFYMNKLSQAKLAARISAQSVRVENWVADSIISDEMHQRMILFDVKLYAIVVQKPKIFKPRQGMLIVDCKDLKIEFFDHKNSKSEAAGGGGGGVLQGGPIKCNHIITGGYSNFIIQEKASSNENLKH